MTSHDLHQQVRQGNLQGVHELLGSLRPGKENGINEYDRRGYTPLMYAVTSPDASVELMRTLLDHGADVRRDRRSDTSRASVVSLALGAGDLLKVRLLIENGANIHYRRDKGYGALIDAVHGRDVLQDERLIDLLQLLIANRVELDSVTSYHESACRVLSRIGRFNAVQVLLDAGADAGLLAWTPLIRAVALGSLAEVTDEVERGAALEERDWWERTAWLVAVQTGDIGKARFLLERGADTSACGRCGQPALFYAIENHHTPMLRWLLEIGIGIGAQGIFGTTSLMDAAGYGNLEAVEDLLQAGADVNEDKDGQTALSFVQTPEIAMRLLEAGADPLRLPFEARRALLGLEPEPDEILLDVSLAEYLDGRCPRFGARNPEPLRAAFCENMIRAGITAYQASELFEEQVDRYASPIWCAQRFGQSITFLTDGRIVQIAREHEDHYDPDFCTYNDVFVHDPDGAIHIFIYPQSIFPPTDFHTATLIGTSIYIIGSLGYWGMRRYGETPVYRLDTNTFKIVEVKAHGMSPGWIYRHRAIPQASHCIRIFGGNIVTKPGREEVCTRNEQAFLFDTQRLTWSIGS